MLIARLDRPGAAAPGGFPSLAALQHTLLAKEREAEYLALDIQQQELRNREIMLKNYHIQGARREMHQQAAPNPEPAALRSQRKALGSQFTKGNWLAPGNILHW